MKQRSPLWPYLLVLGFLFVLSLVAPLGWHASKSSNSPDEVAAALAAAAAARDDQNVESAAVVHPAPQSLESDPHDALAPKSGPDVVATAAEPEEAADKVADVWRFDAAAELTRSRHATDESTDSHQSSSDMPGLTFPLSALPNSEAPAAITLPLQATPDPLPKSADMEPATSAATSDKIAPASAENQTSIQEQAEDGSDESVVDSQSSAGATGSQPIADPPANTQPEQEGVAFETPLPKFLSPVSPYPLPQLNPPMAPIVTTPDVNSDPDPRAAEAEASDQSLPEGKSTEPAPIAPDLPAFEVQPINTIPIAVKAEPARQDTAKSDAGNQKDSKQNKVAAERSPPAVATKPSGWPVAESLNSRLHSLAAHEICCAWANEVDDSLQQLNELAPSDGQGAVKVLKQLRELAEDAGTLAATSHDRLTTGEIRRIQYDLVRRLDLWDEVCAVRLIPAEPAPRSAQGKRLQFCVTQVRAAAAKSDASPGLNDQLMLDKLSQLANQEADEVTTEQRGLAREVLTRLARRRVPAERKTSPAEMPLAALDQQLRHWAAEPIEYTELLKRLEQYEATESMADAKRLAEIRRQLTWSADPAEQGLARRLEMHYRNANVRVALTAALVDRLLPEPARTSEPVNENILGASVSGQSATSTKLSVQLIPDPNTWRFNLVATGSVASQTRAESGPVTFYNQGQTNFTVRKLVLANAYGTRLLPSVAEAAAYQSLAGMETNYDSIPIVRSMVRNYAMGQHDELEGQAQAEAEQRVATRACARVDAEFEPRATAAQDKFRTNVVDPLKKLGLDPMVVTMETSATRLTFRGRLAGSDQLGSQTARPEAPADSLASAQIHESALNNILDRLELSGRTFTLPELLRQVKSRLSRGEVKLPPDLPENVEIKFADQQPLHVRCEQDQLELTLNIAEIHQGKHHWRDFEVRAKYRPVPHGLSCDLERVGTIELGGQYQGRTELTLRGIFSKVLSKDRKLKLLPESIVRDPRLAGLEVTQFVIDDGWIAAAIGPKLAVARR